MAKVGGAVLPAGLLQAGTLPLDRVRVRIGLLDTPVRERLQGAGDRPILVEGVEAVPAEERTVAGRARCHADAGVRTEDRPAQAPSLEPQGKRSRIPAFPGPANSSMVEILPGELALPGVGHQASARCELVAPDEPRPLETAARGELPLGLGRQLCAGPARVGRGVLVRDVRHRVVLAPLDRAVRTLGVPPTGTGHIRPPSPRRVQRHPARRPVEDERARDEECGVDPGIGGAVGRALGHGHPAGGFDEALGTRSPAVPPRQHMARR